MYPKLPPDPTPEEKGIMLEMDSASIYQKIPGLMDKYIIAMVFELGYTQSTVAMCLQVTEGYISQRLTRVKKRLKKEYNLSDTK